MNSIEIHGHGHNVAKRKSISSTPKTNHHILIKRRWRLGDIIMCEPVVRALAQKGNDISFATKKEYHPIVHSFSKHPPKVMSHPPPDDDDVHIADEIIDLNTVTVDHPEFMTKIDAFFAAANIEPSSIDSTQKCPRINPHQRYDMWANIKLKNIGIKGDSIIAIVRQGYSSTSPRSLRPDIIDTIARRLSIHAHILYIGATPVNIPVTSERIHNFTGATPDVTFAGGLLKRCRLVVTVDTGLMHLAGALGIPMLTVMGPTRPDDLATIYSHNSIIDVGRECSPCFDRGCDAPCLDSVDPEKVFQTALWRLEHPDAPTSVDVQC